MSDKEIEKIIDSLIPLEGLDIDMFNKAWGVLVPKDIRPLFDRDDVMRVIKPKARAKWRYQMRNVLGKFK